MGGIVDITQTTWGALGYGYSNWGGSVSLTGLSMTATLGDLAYAGCRLMVGAEMPGEIITGVKMKLPCIP